MNGYIMIGSEVKDMEYVLLLLEFFNGGRCELGSIFVIPRISI